MVVADIYDFDGYQSVRLLRRVSQQADDLVDQFSHLGGQYSALSQHITVIEDAHRDFSLQLEGFQFALNDSLQVSRSCLMACDLGTIDDMIDAQKKILKHINNTPSQMRFAPNKRQRR